MMNEDLRFKIVSIVKQAKEGHIPSSFSILDIIEHLYSKIIRRNNDSSSELFLDRFILSKGHGCLALYVVLNKYGYISDDDLQKYCTADGNLGGHPDAAMIPCVEASTGSLGHGMPTAVGLALSAKIREKDSWTYALVGDGECNEGTIWEAAHIAANLRLDRLIVVVDNNGSSKQLLPIDNLVEKWRAFGWDVYEMDGHSKENMDETFTKILNVSSDKPKIIIANTIKGKGVSFIQGNGAWHHKVPNESEMLAIKDELGI
jgi:transketolase